MNLGVKCETIKLLVRKQTNKQKTIEEDLQDLSKEVLDLTPKAQSRRNNHFDFIKINNTGFTKEFVKRMKR